MNIILQGCHKGAFMKLVGEITDFSINFSYGVSDDTIRLSYDMIDMLIRFSKSHEIKNIEIFEIIKNKYKNALMDTEVWKTRFCFEDIYNEADQSMKDVINSMDLSNLRKFLDHNDWEKGMEAGMMSDWDIVANTCARDSVMPSFVYYLFKHENGKWKKIDEECMDVKSLILARAEFENHYKAMADYFVLFRRIIYE